MIEEDFLFGVQHGRFISYHPNGQVFSQGEFHNGLREGYFRVYDEAGNNIKILFFIHDIQIQEFHSLIHSNERTRENRC
jgi:antitoxin component YwqK of YwqJK toxin-antitoxin module